LDEKSISESVKIIEDNIKSVSLNNARKDDWCCYDFQNYSGENTAPSTPIGTSGAYATTPYYDSLPRGTVNEFELPNTPTGSNGFWSTMQTPTTVFCHTDKKSLATSTGSEFCIVDEPVPSKSTNTTQGDDSEELNGDTDEEQPALTSSNHSSIASTSCAARSILHDDIENELNSSDCSKKPFNTSYPINTPCRSPFPDGQGETTHFTEYTKLSNVFAINSTDLNHQPPNNGDVKAVCEDNQSDFLRLQALLFEGGTVLYYCCVVISYILYFILLYINVIQLYRYSFP